MTASKLCIRTISVLLLCASASGQPQTHVVKVNPDGSFSPQVTYIKIGDTVRWEQLTRTDSIVPVNAAGGYPAFCSTRNAYNPTDPNEFTGPIPFAPSGIFTLSPLTAGFTESTTSCANGRPLIQLNGKVLCQGGAVQATLDSTWKSPHNTGVFIRLLWSDVNPKQGVYDFAVFQREMEQAVKAGKLVSVGIKAGDDGTPDWIFSTNADGTARANGGGGVPRLHLQDTDSASVTSCGNRMDLGNPTRSTYRQLYSAVLTELARVIKTRADWYRALAYVKISGANLVSHENRLPDTCAVVDKVACICNPAVFAADGYRPSGLTAFYDEQTKLLHDLFPGKPMSYALIQDGFPKVNETGGYMLADGNSSDKNPLPGAFELTQNNLDRGQQTWAKSFVVQHNGIMPRPASCTFGGQHPKPLVGLNGYWDVGSGCPNRWAVREGAQGQITGFQTTNEVGTPAEVDSALQNQWDNSDGIFFELYESAFWQATNTNGGVLPISGKSLSTWGDDFQKRRIDPIFPAFTGLANPFPATYSYTFTKSVSGGATQTLAYIHGMKCGLGNQEWGKIIIDAQPPTISAGGVVTASAFGQFKSIAPGAWIEIYGSGFAGTARPWGGADFIGLSAPTALDGTSVKIGGQSAFVDFISATQVNAQVPSNVATGTQQLTVTTPAGTSASFSVTVNATQPGLLAPVAFNVGGKQYVVALFPDGVTYVMPPNAIAGVPSRRARAGDTIILYGVGFGAVTPNIVAGQIVKQANTLVAPLAINFGSARAVVPFSGLASDAVGLYQFNVVVPAVIANDAMPVSFTLGGASGTQVLYTAVQ